MIEVLVEAKKFADSAIENGEQKLSEDILLSFENKFERLILEADKLNPRNEKTDSK